VAFAPLRNEETWPAAADYKESEFPPIGNPWFEKVRDLYVYDHHFICVFLGMKKNGGR
jgi:hypothetical protein